MMFIFDREIQQKELHDPYILFQPLTKGSAIERQMGLVVEEATEAAEAETADRFSKLFSSPMQIYGK